MIKEGVILRKDYRDRFYSYHHNKLKFGAPTPTILPKTLGRTLEKSFQQDATYLCPGYSTALAGQYRHRIPMSPEWQSGKVSEQTGSSIAHVGADPRDGMKAACVFGHQPKVNVPFTLQEKGEDYVADWTHYPSDIDKLAFPLHEKGYKPIIPLKDQDQFDAIRSAMYQEFLVHGQNSSPVLMATDWYSNFNEESKIMRCFMRVSAHMYNAVDFDTIDGIDYLLIQSSSGEASMKWFSRDVVNKLYQNPAAFCAIFNDDERFRNNFIIEVLLKFYYALRNYTNEITR